MIKLVVLDYDGTFTDIRDGNPGFDALYLRGLAELLAQADLRQDWERVKELVRRRSPEQAWTIGGHATAPATADPYSLASTAAVQLLDERGLPARRAALSEIYAQAYKDAPYAFRPDARSVLAKLRETVPTCFVTNSDSGVVTQRLTERLFPAGLDNLGVMGNAQKFAIVPPGEPDARFEKIAPETQEAHLERKILLGRGKYFDVLKQLWQLTGADAATTLVCGDVWELDLALPEALGAQVHLILRDNTFPYEHAAVKRAGARGGCSANLLPILDRL
jgi:hypothetical protein